MSGVRVVSVIVPTRDRPGLLRTALASIRTLEDETLRFDIIVADNGGSPHARAVAEEAGARYVSVTKGRGASIARNAALREARGDYIAFLDDDDVWLPTHIRSHLAHLDAHPEHDAVVGRVISADHDLRPVSQPWPAQPPADAEDLLRRMLSGYFPQIGSVVARACVRETIGRFDPALLGGEDLDWLLRLARRRRLGFTPAHSVLFRGRRRGADDALQLSRAGYDRWVFLRHALLEPRLWRSRGEFFAAWYGTLRHFYVHFTDAAASRAARGHRRAALAAVGSAFMVFPVRATYHVLTRKRLGKAFWAALFDVRTRRSRSRLSPYLPPALPPALLLAERLGPILHLVSG